MTAESEFRALLAASSLGSREAKALRQRTPKARARAAVELSGTKSRLSVRGVAYEGHEGPLPADLDLSKEHLHMAGRKTSAKAAKAASKVLRDGRTSKASKTAAGSALSQRAPKKGK